MSDQHPETEDTPTPTREGPHITVVGIGADGWAGLSDRARQAIRDADEVVGSGRQLAGLTEPELPPLTVWPVPLQSLLDEIVARTEGTIVVLASGDPLHYGIGATLVRRLGPEAMAAGRLSFISAPSAFSLACARLGWPADEVSLLSTVGRPATAITRLLQPNRRIVVYVAGPDGASEVAQQLVDKGFGESALYVLEQLGSPTHEQVTSTTAAEWGDRRHDPLTTLAIVAQPHAAAPHFLTSVPGLPDGAYMTDGLLTKRHVRASSLALLQPAPGQLLWDIGAGSGSIAIEWLRAEPSAHAIAIEADAERAARLHHNAENLGVPQLRVLTAAAPDVFAQLIHEPPDAIFIGGGLSQAMLDQSWELLTPGGRLVANAVTIESEQLLLSAMSAHGGELVKLSVSHAEPLGSYRAWRPALPIVQWAAIKP